MQRIYSRRIGSDGALKFLSGQTDFASVARNGHPAKSTIEVISTSVRSAMRNSWRYAVAAIALWKRPRSDWVRHPQNLVGCPSASGANCDKHDRPAGKRLPNARLESKRSAAVNPIHSLGDCGIKMTRGQLLGFTRASFDSDERRNCSVALALCRKWGLEEAEVLIRGAQFLGWKDIISLNAKEGIGRRWAHAAYWAHQNASPGPSLEAVGQMLRKAGIT